MDFYNIGGIVVTDTTFITPNGDQYPIRNITSVQVREKNYWVLLVFGILFFSIGILAVIDNPNETKSALPSLLFGVILVIWWFFSRQYILWIGAGGITQKSLKFPKRDNKNLVTLIKIAEAINQSIASLQK